MRLISPSLGPPLPKPNDQIESVPPHQASLHHRHRDRHTHCAIGLALVPRLQSCCPPRRSNTMVEHILKLKPTGPCPLGDN
jgi:hypothetical protein